MGKYRKDIVMYFYFIQLPNVMQEKYQVIPDSDLSQEFLSQFKREADVSKTITHKTPKLKLKFKLKITIHPKLSSLKLLDTISRGTYIWHKLQDIKKVSPGLLQRTLCKRWRRPTLPLAQYHRRGRA